MSILDKVRIRIHAEFTQVNCRTCGQGASTVGSDEERNANIREFALDHSHQPAEVEHGTKTNSLLNTLNSAFV